MAAYHVGAGILLAAAAAGAVTGNEGPLSLPMAQVGLVSFFAVLGATARVFLDAKEARDAAAKAGADPSKLPKVDIVSLGYAILGAPFVGSLAYAGIRWIGVFPDYAVATIIMGMGYLGRDGINIVISIVKGIVQSRFGAKS